MAITKITPEVLDRICAHIREGMPIKYACAREGVTARALRMRQAADDDVAIAVDRARGEAYRAREAKLFELIDEGSRTANTMLQYMVRSDPDALQSPTQRIEQSGPDGKPLEVTWYLPSNPRIPQLPSAVEDDDSEADE